MNAAMENSNEILNDLIRINNDRIEGYTKAEKESKDRDADLVSTFQKMERQSNDHINDLKSLISRSGGAIVTGSTVMGKIYRVWMDLQITFSANDRKNILNACEYGEDAAQKTYAKALEESSLTEEVRSLISAQKWELKKSHDLIKKCMDQKVTS